MDLPKIRILTLLACILSGVLQEVFCGTSGVGNLEYVGCFDLSYSVTKNYHRRYSYPKLENCLAKCIPLKTRYIGIEYNDNYCYCGGDIAEESRKRNDSLCYVPCPGMPDRTCGGEWLMSLYEPKVVELPDEHVSFLIGLSVGIRLYNSSNLNSFNTLMVTSGDWVFTVDYHFKKNFVFGHSNKKIYRMNFDKGSRPVPIRTVTSCDGMAVDWEHDRIYWEACSANGSNSIMSMDLNGENATEVLSRPQTVIKRMEVDPYIGKLFWISAGTIESCDLSGTEFLTNISAADVMVRTLTLDLQARRVYYVGSVNQTTRLLSMDYDGSNSVEHASLTQMRSVYGMGVLAGRLYWVNYANSDVIYTAPLPLNTSDNVIVLAEINRAVWHMRLVHPDLQKPPRRDPCEFMGCSHSCKSQSAASARCTCPTGLTLAEDQVTCTVLAKFPREQEREGQQGWMVTVTLMLIVIVLLLTVVLIYLTDKYWPQLQAKMACLDVAYSRKRNCERESSVTPVYDAVDDNVNLM